MSDDAVRPAGRPQGGGQRGDAGFSPRGRGCAVARAAGGDVLNQVTARAVAERVGRTTGVFFHQWPTLEAQQRDLPAYILDPARMPSTPEAADAVLGGLGAGVDPAEVLHLAARGNFAGVRIDPYGPLWQALWSKHQQDERVSTLLRQNFDGVTGQLVPLLEACLAAGRRMQPPFTVETFAVLITALVQGLNMRQAIEPELVPVQPTGEEGSRNLFGTTVEVLFRTLTAEAAEQV